MLNNIEAERGRMRMTKLAISNELGITVKTYCAYINGEHNVPHTILIKMSKMFNCSIDYLLGLSETRT